MEDIRKRFDANVERFSNLETGQAATIDSPLAMALIAEVAAAVTPKAASVLDIGCGAGNYTLKLLERLPNLNVVLVDLSRPMLDRAMDRIRPATTGNVEAIQGDIREIDIGVERHDIILAASVLHHLRSDAQWRAVFEKFYRALRPGGAIWIFDLIESSIPEAQAIMWRRYPRRASSTTDLSHGCHPAGSNRLSDNVTINQLSDIGKSVIGHFRVMTDSRHGQKEAIY